MNRFVDSNVIIYAFTNSNQKQECRNILTQENLIINTLVLLESYAKISTINSEVYARVVARNILSLANIRVVDFTNNLFFESIKRSQKYKLKISDLVHYATALLHNCSEIISYDAHFDGLDVKRVEP
ncbi:PIN domain-containing protein [Candidatus Woesearchaeota archaeon]|nr:PIN domain-containing protein [Candidatus Woesearchaeota archaeon]